MQTSFERGIEQLADVQDLGRQMFLPANSAFEFLFRTSPIQMQRNLYDKDLLFNYGPGGTFPDSLKTAMITDGAVSISSK